MPEILIRIERVQQHGLVQQLNAFIRVAGVGQVIGHVGHEVRIVGIQLQGLFVEPDALIESLAVEVGEAQFTKAPGIVGIKLDLRARIPKPGPVPWPIRSASQY